MFEAMLDIETMGTRKDAVVLSVALVPFTPDDTGAVPGKAFYYRLLYQEQIDMGRSVDMSTMAWWAKQDPAVMQEAFGSDGMVYVDGPFNVQRTGGLILGGPSFFDALRDWTERLKITKVWSKGPHFDAAILESLAEDYGESLPWSFRANRDCRTMEDYLSEADWTLIKNMVSPGQQHHPLDDCMFQIASLKLAKWNIRNGKL